MTAIEIDKLKSAEIEHLREVNAQQHADLVALRDLSVLQARLLGKIAWRGGISRELIAELEEVVASLFNLSDQTRNAMAALLAAWDSLRNLKGVSQ